MTEPAAITLTPPPVNIDLPGASPETVETVREVARRVATESYGAGWRDGWQAGAQAAATAIEEERPPGRGDRS